MADEPIYKKYITKFNGIEVYPNRVVISEGTFAKTETTILIRSITGVALDGPAKFLKISSQDGKTYQAKFLAGKIAQEVQSAIMKIL